MVGIVYMDDTPISIYTQDKMSTISLKVVHVLVFSILILIGYQVLIWIPNQSDQAITMNNTQWSGVTVENLKIVTDPVDLKNGQIELKRDEVVIKSPPLDDSSFFEFIMFDVVTIASDKIVVVGGLDVGAHSSSTRFYWVNDNEELLVPICFKGIVGEKCAFWSDRLSEPLIVDLNNDDNPEVVELHERVDRSIVATIYAFVSNSGSSAATEADKYKLTLLEPENLAYERLQHEYGDLLVQP